MPQGINKRDTSPQTETSHDGVQTPTSAAAVGQINTTARQAISTSLQETPQENQTNISEKVSGLETLAAAGLPTPKHRLYLDAGYFNNPSEEKEDEYDAKVEAYIQQIRASESYKPESDALKSDECKIIIRSAHPRESEFSGGAFHSKKTIISSFYPHQEVKRIRYAEIIRKSKPENSPHVRRDISLKGIQNFNVNDMGVYLNEDIPSVGQITVVPLDNGQISLRYFTNGRLESENVDPAVNPREGIHLVDHKRNGNEQAVMIYRHMLIEDIKKAQACFDTPQEFEIQIIYDPETDEGKWVFVQAKSVTPESTQNDAIPEDIFRDGAKSWHPNCWKGHAYANIRASKRDILRETKAIIIDEVQWVKDWVLEHMPSGTMFDDERIFEDVSKRNFDRRFNIQKFVMTTPELYQAMIEKYRELTRMAEKTSIVTIMKRKTAIEFNEYAEDDTYKNDPAAEYIIREREILASLASVLFQGTTEGDNDINTDNHRIVGTGGLSQIQIRYQLNESSYDQSDTGNWKNIDRLKDLKDGDTLIVMIKGGVTSLYVPELL